MFGFLKNADAILHHLKNVRIMFLSHMGQCGCLLYKSFSTLWGYILYCPSFPHIIQRCTWSMVRIEVPSDAQRYLNLARWLGWHQQSNFPLMAANIQIFNKCLIYYVLSSRYMVGKKSKTFALMKISFVEKETLNK